MRRTRLFVGLIGLIALSLVVSGCLNLFAPKVGEVKGKVAYESGTPIPDAQVKLGTAVAKTNAQGEYAFINMKQGTYDFSVVVGGKQVHAQKVTVGDKPTIVNVTLPDPIQYGKVVGSVKREDGTPLSGITVHMGDLTATTDAAGAFEFANVPYGTYTVKVEVDGKEYSAAANLDAPQITVDIVIPDLITEGDVVGVVKDAADRPVQGAKVTLGEHATTTDSDGNFEFSGVNFGTYALAVSVWDEEVHSATVTVDDETVLLDIVIDVAKVSGHIVDQDDNPIADAVIKLGPGVISTTSGADGSYSLTNVPYATYVVTVEVDGDELSAPVLEVDQPDVAYNAQVTLPVAEPVLVYEEDFSTVTDLAEAGWSTPGAGWSLEEKDGRKWIKADHTATSHAYIRIPELADADVITLEYRYITPRTGGGSGAMIPANNPANPLGGETYFLFRKWDGVVVRIMGMGTQTDLPAGPTVPQDTETTFRFTFDRVNKQIHVLRDGVDEYTFNLEDDRVIPKGAGRDVLQLYVNDAEALWTDIKVWVQ